VIVLILLIVAAVLFGLTGIYSSVPPRNEWPRGLVAEGLCLMAIAMAFWHAGK